MAESDSTDSSGWRNSAAAIRSSTGVGSRPSASAIRSNRSVAWAISRPEARSSSTGLPPLFSSLALEGKVLGQGLHLVLAEILGTEGLCEQADALLSHLGIAGRRDDISRQSH